MIVVKMFLSLIFAPWSSAPPLVRATSMMMMTTTRTITTAFQSPPCMFTGVRRSFRQPRCLFSTSSQGSGRGGGGGGGGGGYQGRGRRGGGSRQGGPRPSRRDPTVPPERVAELEARRHDGFLAINKPEGWGSADVVAKVKATMEKTLRTSLGQRIEIKVGHGGTLDPIATGVLVLGLGAACKDISSFLKGSKSYEAVGMLGAEYDTMDRTGKVLETVDSSHVTEDMLQSALPKFRGKIMQRPPAFSAIKRGGKPVYALAREGIAVELPERPVEIFSLDLVPGHTLPEFGLTCSVGGGTYIRSLISDLARSVDARGYMTQLVRTSQGPFALDHTLDASMMDDYEALYRHMLKCNKLLREYLATKGPQW